MFSLGRLLFPFENNDLRYNSPKIGQYMKGEKVQFIENLNHSPRHSEQVFKVNLQNVVSTFLN